MNAEQHAVGQVKPLAFDYKEASIRFVNVELDLAITFCEFGLVTAKKETANRNAENARKALSAVEKFAGRIALGSSEKNAILEKIAHLTRLLTELERNLQSL